MIAVIQVILLILISFIPPIIYAKWFRNIEHYSKEPYSTVFSTFIWGSTFGVMLAIGLEIVFSESLFFVFQMSSASRSIILVTPSNLISRMSELNSTPSLGSLELLSILSIVNAANQVAS